MIAFSTRRLSVKEVSRNVSLVEQQALIKSIPDILTPEVVECLPVYFHGIDNEDRAGIWLDQMMLESRLMTVSSDSGQTIGFLFVSTDNGLCVHIGYLLAKEHWGQGLASDLITGFITEVVNTQSWTSLIAGVDQANLGSIKLLTKCGFVQRFMNEQGVIFYEYRLR